MKNQFSKQGGADDNREVSENKQSRMRAQRTTDGGHYGIAGWEQNVTHVMPL